MVAVAGGPPDADLYTDPGHSLSLEPQSVLPNALSLLVALARPRMALRRLLLCHIWDR